jgi:hypothetical protein
MVWSGLGWSCLVRFGLVWFRLISFDLQFFTLYGSVMTVMTVIMMIIKNKLSSLSFPLWIRSLDLFQHRRIAIVSWGVHDLFFL